MTQIFKSKALGYQAIHEAIIATGVKGATVGELNRILEANEHVTGMQQIADCVKQLHKKGLVLRTKLDGNRFLYMAAPTSITTATLAPTPEPKVTAVASPEVKTKPEIVVNESSIVINHAKCKITIEF